MVTHTLIVGGVMRQRQKRRWKYIKRTELGRIAELNGVWSLGLSQDPHFIPGYLNWSLTDISHNTVLSTEVWQQREKWWKTWQKRETIPYSHDILATQTFNVSIIGYLTVNYGVEYGRSSSHTTWQPCVNKSSLSVINSSCRKSDTGG